VVVDNLDFERVARIEPFAIATKHLQHVPRWNPKIVDNHRRIDHIQLRRALAAQRFSGIRGWTSSR
jgi:hypothetical protein